MKSFIDVEKWRADVGRSFSDLASAVAEYLPLVVGALAILLVGWLIAKLAGAVVGWILRRAGLDRGASRLRLAETMQRAGITTPLSRIIGQITFWVLMLTFARAAVDTLRLETISIAIERLVGYLPNLLAAAGILLFGFVMARLARNLVSSAAATVDLPQASQVGAATHGLLVLVAAVMALERLGLDTQVLVASLTALVATFGLTVGLAFALGAKPLVTHILAGHFLRQRLPGDAIVEVQGKRGMVERIGSVDTVLKEGEQAWSIPNALLLEEIVSR